MLQYLLETVSLEPADRVNLCGMVEEPISPAMVSVSAAARYNPGITVKAHQNVEGNAIKQFGNVVAVRSGWWPGSTEYQRGDELFN